MAVGIFHRVAGDSRARAGGGRGAATGPRGRRPGRRGDPLDLPRRGPAGRPPRPGRPPGHRRPGSPGMDHDQQVGDCVLSQLLLGERVLVTELRAGRLGARGRRRAAGGEARPARLSRLAARRPAGPAAGPSGRGRPQLVVDAPPPTCTPRRTVRVALPGVVLGTRLAPGRPGSSTAGCPVPRSRARRAALGSRGRRGRRCRPSAPAAEEVLAVADRLRDVVYVWGGLSAYGIDCSGLVHLAWRRFGVTLPRDADDQAAATTPRAARRRTPRRPLLLRPARPPDPPRRHRHRRAARRAAADAARLLPAAPGGRGGAARRPGGHPGRRAPGLTPHAERGAPDDGGAPRPTGAVSAGPRPVRGRRSRDDLTRLATVATARVPRMTGSESQIGMCGAQPIGSPPLMNGRLLSAGPPAPA